MHHRGWGRLRPLCSAAKDGVEAMEGMDKNGVPFETIEKTIAKSLVARRPKISYPIDRRPTAAVFMRRIASDRLIKRMVNGAY